MSDTTTTNIQVNIDASQALSQINALSQSISNFNRSVLSSSQTAVRAQTDFNKALAANLVATRQFDVSFGTAQSTVKTFSQSLESGKMSFGEYVKYGIAASKRFSSAFKEESKIIDQLATDRVKKLQTQYVALGKTVDGVTQVMKVTPNELAPGLGTNLAVSTQKAQIFNKILKDGSTSLINWGKNTQWAGRQLMVGFTVPLMVFASKAGKAFADLEKQALRFRRVYGDMFTTPAETEKALADIKQLSSEMTKYGIAVSETIRMAADAAAAGKKGAELRASVAEAVRLSVLGEVDQQEALKTTIALQNAYKINARDLGGAINYLNAVENQSVLSIQDLTAAIPRLGPIIQQLGGDIKDTSVFLAAMKEAGISAEQGANALKSGLASMINPTKKAQETLAGFGIDIKKIVKDNEGNLMGMVTAVANAMNGLSGIAKQQAMEEVFGKFQFARVGALLDNITQKGSQANQVLQLANTSAIELAALSQKELLAIETSPLTKLKKALEDLKTAIAPIGETFIKVATPLVEIVTKLAKIFASLPEPVKLFTVGLLVAVPAFTMLVGLTANFIGTLLKIGNTMREFAQRLMGGGKNTKFLTEAQLEAIASTQSLEGRMHSLTGEILLQKGAYKSLIGVLRDYAVQASKIPSTNPAGFMGRAKAPIKMARGGTVPGTGNEDSQPALLMPGEIVMTKEASQKFGPILHAMNRGKIGMFAKSNSPSNPIPIQATKETLSLQLQSVVPKSKAALLEDVHGTESYVFKIISIWKNGRREIQIENEQLLLELEQGEGELANLARSARQVARDVEGLDESFGDVQTTVKLLTSGTVGLTKSPNNRFFKSGVPGEELASILDVIRNPGQAATGVSFKKGQSTNYPGFNNPQTGKPYAPNAGLSVLFGNVFPDLSSKDPKVRKEVFKAVSSIADNFISYIRNSGKIIVDDTKTAVREAEKTGRPLEDFMTLESALHSSITEFERSTEGQITKSVKNALATARKKLQTITNYEFQIKAKPSVYKKLAEDNPETYQAETTRNGVEILRTRLNDNYVQTSRSGGPREGSTGARTALETPIVLGKATLAGTKEAIKSQSPPQEIIARFKALGIDIGKAILQGLDSGLSLDEIKSRLVSAGNEAGIELTDTLADSVIQTVRQESNKPRPKMQDAEISGWVSEFSRAGSAKGTLPTTKFKYINIEDMVLQRFSEGLTNEQVVNKVLRKARETGVEITRETAESLVEGIKQKAARPSPDQLDLFAYGEAANAPGQHALPGMSPEETAAEDARVVAAKQAADADRLKAIEAQKAANANRDEANASALAANQQLENTDATEENTQTQTELPEATGKFSAKLFKATAAVDAVALGMSMMGGKMGEWGSKLFMATSMVGSMGMVATQLKGPVFSGLAKLGLSSPQAALAIGGLTVATIAGVAAFKYFTKKVESYGDKVENEAFKTGLQMSRALNVGQEFLTSAGIKRKGETQINTEGTQFAGKEDLFKTFKVDVSPLQKSSDVMKDAAFQIFTSMQTMDMSSKDLNVFIENFASQIAKLGKGTTGQIKTELIAQITKMYAGDVDILKDPMTVEMLAKLSLDPESGIKALQGQFDQIQKDISNTGTKVTQDTIDKTNKQVNGLKTNLKNAVNQANNMVGDVAGLKKFEVKQDKAGYQVIDTSGIKQTKKEIENLKKFITQARASGNDLGADQATVELKKQEGILKRQYMALKVMQDAADKANESIKKLHTQQAELTNATQNGVINQEKNNKVLQTAITMAQQFEQQRESGAIGQSEYNKYMAELTPIINKASEANRKYLAGLDTNKLKEMRSEQENLLKTKFSMSDEDMNKINETMAKILGVGKDSKEGRLFGYQLMKAVADGMMTMDQKDIFLEQLEAAGPVVKEYIGNNPEMFGKILIKAQVDPTFMQDLPRATKEIENIFGVNSQPIIDVMLKAESYKDFLSKLDPEQRNLIESNKTAQVAIQAVFTGVVGGASVAGPDAVVREAKEKAKEEIKKLEDEIKAEQKASAARIEAAGGAELTKAFRNSVKNMKLPGIGGGAVAGPMISEAKNAFKITIPAREIKDASGAMIKIGGNTITATKSMKGFEQAAFQANEQLQQLSEIEFGWDQQIKQADKELKKLNDTFDERNKKLEQSFKYGINKQTEQANAPGQSKAMLNVFERQTRQQGLMGTADIKIRPDMTEFTYESIKDKIPKITDKDILDFKEGRKGVEDFQKMFKLDPKVLENGQKYLQILRDAQAGVAGGKEAWDALGKDVQADVELLQQFGDKAAEIGALIEYNITAKFNKIKEQLETDWPAAVNQLLSQTKYDTAVKVQLEPGIDAKGLDNNEIRAKFESLKQSLGPIFDGMSGSFEDAAQKIQDDADKASKAIEDKFKARIDSVELEFSKQTKKMERDWEDATTQMERDWSDKTDAIEKGYQQETDAMQKAYNEFLKIENKKWDEQQKSLQQKQDAEKKSLEASYDTKGLEDEKQKKLDAINQAYDAQSKALEEISKYEQFITDQKSQQVDLASAIASGDIAAAAKAAGAMSQAQSEFMMAGGADNADKAKEAQLKAIEDEYQARIDAQNSAKESAMAALEETHAKEMEAFQESREKHFQDIQDAFDLSMKLRDEQHQKDMKLRDRSHEDEMKLRDRNHQDAMEKRDTEHQRVIQNINDEKERELTAVRDLQTARTNALNEFKTLVDSAISNRDAAEKKSVQEVTDSLNNNELKAYQGIKSEVDKIGNEIDEQNSIISGSYKAALDAASAQWLDMKNNAQIQKDKISETKDDINTMLGIYGTSKDNVDFVTKRMEDASKALIDAKQNAIEGWQKLIDASPGDALKMLSAMHGKDFAKLDPDWLKLINIAEGIQAGGGVGALNQAGFTAVGAAVTSGTTSTTGSGTGSVRAIKKTGDSDTGNKPSASNSVAASSPARKKASVATGGDDNFLKTKFIGGARDLFPESATGLEPTFKQKLIKLLQAFPGLRVHSAFRPMWKQEELWQNQLRKTNGDVAAARKMVAPPGRSMHGMINGIGGRAVDITYTGGEKGAVHSAASKFGLKFPMSWEDWHIEDTSTRGGNETDIADDVEGMIGAAGAPLTETVAFPTPQEAAKAMFYALLNGKFPDINTWPMSNSIQVPIPGTEGMGMAEGGLVGEDASLSATLLNLPANIVNILKTIRHFEGGDDPGAYSRKTSLKASASGAYQYVDGTWRAKAGKEIASKYPSAYLAPPAIQDQVAAKNVQEILRGHKNQVEAVPVFWYYPKAWGNPSIMNSVPAKETGNTMSVFDYQKKWMGYYAKISKAAQGAYVEATPGGKPFIVGEGGQPEIISPVSKMYQTVLDALMNFFKATNKTPNVDIMSMIKPFMKSSTGTGDGQVKQLNDERDAMISSLTREKNQRLADLEDRKKQTRQQLDYAKATNASATEIKRLEDQLSNLNDVQKQIEQTYTSNINTINKDIDSKIQAISRQDTYTTAVDNSTGSVDDNSTSVDGNTTSIDINTSALETMSGSASAASESLDAVSGSGDATSASLDTLTASSDALTSSIDTLNSSISDNLTPNVDDLNDAFVNALTPAVDELWPEIDNTTAALADFQSQLATTLGEAQTAAQAATQAASTANGGTGTGSIRGIESPESNANAGGGTNSGGNSSTGSGRSVINPVESSSMLPSGKHGVYNPQNKLYLSGEWAGAYQPIADLFNDRATYDAYINSANPARMNMGGMIPSYLAMGGMAEYYGKGGPKGTDTVPAWLTPGEFVIRKDVAQKYKHMLPIFNKTGKLPQYHADGGSTLPISTLPVPYVYVLGPNGEIVYSSPVPSDSAPSAPSAPPVMSNTTAKPIDDIVQVANTFTSTITDVNTLLSATFEKFKSSMMDIVEAIKTSISSTMDKIANDIRTVLGITTNAGKANATASNSNTSATNANTNATSTLTTANTGAASAAGTLTTANVGAASAAGTLTTANNSATSAMNVSSVAQGTLTTATNNSSSALAALNPQLTAFSVSVINGVASVTTLAQKIAQWNAAGVSGNVLTPALANQWNPGGQSGYGAVSYSPADSRSAVISEQNLARAFALGLNANGTSFFQDNLGLPQAVVDQIRSNVAQGLIPTAGITFNADGSLNSQYYNANGTARTDVPISYMNTTSDTLASGQIRTGTASTSTNNPAASTSSNSPQDTSGINYAALTPEEMATMISAGMLSNGGMVKVMNAANGAVVNPTPGGTLYRVGEAGSQEVISPIATLYRTVSNALSNVPLSLDPASIYAMSQNLARSINSTLGTTQSESNAGNAQRPLTDEEKMQIDIEKQRLLLDQKGIDVTTDQVALTNKKNSTDTRQASLDATRIANTTILNTIGRTQVANGNQLNAATTTLTTSTTGQASANQGLSASTSTLSTSTQNQTTAASAAASSLSTFSGSLSATPGYITSLGVAASNAASALNGLTTILNGITGPAGATGGAAPTPSPSGATGGPQGPQAPAAAAPAAAAPAAGTPPSPWVINAGYATWDGTGAAPAYVTFDPTAWRSWYTSRGLPIPTVPPAPTPPGPPGYERPTSRPTAGATGPSGPTNPNNRPAPVVNGATGPQGPTQAVVTAAPTPAPAARPAAPPVVVPTVVVPAPAPSAPARSAPAPTPATQPTQIIPQVIPTTLPGSTDYPAFAAAAAAQTGLAGIPSVPSSEPPSWATAAAAAAGLLSSGGMVPKYFARGGPSGTDTVPAWLTPGEFVVNRASTAKFGGLLDAINSGQTPKFDMPDLSTYDSIVSPSDIQLTNVTSSPVYNINVSVQSNADANQIANAIKRDMRRSEDRTIRGYRQ